MTWKLLALAGLAAAMSTGLAIQADAEEMGSLDAFGGAAAFADSWQLGHASDRRKGFAIFNGTETGLDDGNGVRLHAPILDLGGPDIDANSRADGHRSQDEAWSVMPSFSLSLSSRDVGGLGRADGLGVMAAARIDSRIGAVYSRLGLSFEHTLRRGDGFAVAGPSGGGIYSDRMDRSQLNVMRVDSVFGVWMAESAAGLLSYRAETDITSELDHRMMVRFRFDF